MPGENHGWMSMDRYLAIHERCLEQAEEHFVLSHDLHKPSFRPPDLVQLSGVIQCHNGIEIHVFLELLRDNRDRVRGRQFRYHAQRRVLTTVNPPAPHAIYILRYDNAKHFREHPDAFHKHVFSIDGRSETVEHIGREHFPTLRDVIDEVFEWWRNHRDRLPDTL